ncbi:MAG: hypothetical protein HN348_00830 [Proteobacteria bacterium]|mgnify:CR=1 FL=1|jgi:hypothetical protein|nr:hypothetical protein [Pseudomonadota bacterium]
MEAATISDLFELQRELRRRRTRISALLEQASLSPATYKRAVATLDNQLQLKRGLEASRVAYRLFRYWHLFHRPLASAMYVIALLHIVFAIFFGGSLSKLMGLIG